MAAVNSRNIESFTLAQATFGTADDEYELDPSAGASASASISALARITLNIFGSLTEKETPERWATPINTPAQ